MNSGTENVVKDTASARCAACQKSQALCVCAAIREVNCRTKVLILQHPQEKKEDLSTASLIQCCLTQVALCTGLSWRSLSHAWASGIAGERIPLDPKSWGVLYLGTKAKSTEASQRSATQEQALLMVVDKNGSPVAKTPEILSKLQGIVALDGNWRQSKALWWRNPWLLKLHRLVVFPKKPSLYGKLRREPRKESISTIEALAATLSELESNPRIEAQLLEPFELLLRKYGNWKQQQ